MKTNPTFSKHFAALTFLFILFDSLLALPTDTIGEYYLPLSIAAAFCIGFVVFISELFALSFLIKCNCAVSKLFLLIILVASAVLGLFFGAQSFVDFIRFVSYSLFENKAKLVVGIAFAAVLFFVLKQKSKSLLKFSLLAAVFAVVTLVLFLVTNFKNGSYKNFNFKDILPAELIGNIKNIFCTAVLPSVLLPVFLCLLPEKQQKKSAPLGFLPAFVFCFLCMAAPIFLFGAGFANTLKFPFAAFVSTTSVGSLFTRLDALFYFLIFASALIKIATCFYVSFMALKKIKEFSK